MVTSYVDIDAGGMAAAHEGGAHHLRWHGSAMTRGEVGRLLAILAGILLVFLPLLLVPHPAAAHEAWLLTPDQITKWDAEPKPLLFTRLTPTNAAMLAAAFLAIVGWLLLAAGGAEDRCPRLLARLQRFEAQAPLIVRVCVALTLLMAALGLHPRHGTGLCQAATLGFPDLELRLLGPGWGWLAGVELAIATALVLGLYVRTAGAAILALTALGLWLFGVAMLAYAGALAGAGAYLALRGGGPWCVPLPGLARPANGDRRLRRERASFLMRVLTGAAFLWCGIYYKVLQPNLVLAIIIGGDVPTFGLTPEAFVFAMALVEVAAGALMMAGVLIRPMALILFGPFLFLSIMLGESPLGHVLFYGNLLALATGGAGSWLGTVRPRKLVAPGLPVSAR